MSFPFLEICAADEVPSFASRSLTHLISIRNPGAPSSRPSWFQGEILELRFGDVFSERDARACQTVAATADDVRRAIEFASAAFRSSSRMLVSCDYGASRSPAIAYVVLAAQAGPGLEEECFQHILAIRPVAFPNKHIVRLGDACLSRSGALLIPFQKYEKQFFNDPL